MIFRTAVVAYLVILFNVIAPASAQVWQWSAAAEGVISPETRDHPQAFLWIPENCKYVRGVVLGQHNMLEEGIFEHSHFRKTMTKLGFAIVWVTPMFNLTFDWEKGSAQEFTQIMIRLAEVSGYEELKIAPVVPVGHSALASYPWNFAAWNPDRTLAVVSIHGDAPQTGLTGSGRPNPDWKERSIDGVPGLMVMGEYEWWEDRLMPAFDYVARHPKTPFCLLADAGRGHFDNSEQMIGFVALFIEKAARYRLPQNDGQQKQVTLKPVAPDEGWLIDRWRKDALPAAKTAPYHKYKGDRRVATWCFDKEMALATEKIYRRSRGKARQYLGFVQQGELLRPASGHAVYQIPFLPEADGISFRLKSAFTDSTGLVQAAHHPAPTIKIDRICGPVYKVNDTTFQIRFYRMGLSNPRRSSVIWLLASNEGDKDYKSVVQQAELRFPMSNREGIPQRISFESIQDQKLGTKSVKLNARSDAGMPVHYYVKHGPATVDGDKLVFTAVPPRSRLPLQVTVVGWQYGASTGRKVQTATPVERSFMIVSK